MKPLCCFCVLSLLLMATSIVAKPTWIANPIDSEYFVYFVGMGVDSSELSAKEKAVSNAMQLLSQYHMLHVQSFSEYTQITESTTDISYEYDNSSKTISLTGKGLNISGVRIADEYTEEKQGIYKHHILIRLPKSLEFSTMPLYKGYGMLPIVKSALLPGWGQIAKNERNKGQLIMASEGITALSAVTFILIGDYYQNRSRNISLSYSEQERCRENADTSYLYGNISLSLAAVIYLYNIIDVVSSRGSKLFTRITEAPLQIALVNEYPVITYRVRF